jgi:hypothetical protein
MEEGEDKEGEGGIGRRGQCAVGMTVQDEATWKAVMQVCVSGHVNETNLASNHKRRKGDME